MVVCAMAKNENKYINDWVNWYLSIGVDKIYLYDNNDISTQYVGECIEQIDKVVIKDVRNVVGEKIQQKIYTSFYNEYGNTFDWCIFVDIDEFLQVDNVKTFLSNTKYNDYEQIRVMWKLFGDDNLIERNETIPVYKSFHRVIKKTYNRDLVHIGNLERQGKFIVKGHLKDVVITSPHFASHEKRENLLKSCLPSGAECNSKVVIYECYDNEKVYINHYMTKTLKEFVEQKLNRSDAVYGYNIKLNYYWRVNAITMEKVAYLRKRGII